MKKYLSKTLGLVFIVLLSQTALAADDWLTPLKTYITDDRRLDPSLIFASPETLKKYMTCDNLGNQLSQAAYTKNKQKFKMRIAIAKSLGEELKAKNIKILKSDVVESKTLSKGSHLPLDFGKCTISEPIEWKKVTVVHDYFKTPEDMAANKPRKKITGTYEVYKLDQWYVKRSLKESTQFIKSEK